MSIEKIKEILEIEQAQENLGIAGYASTEPYKEPTMKLSEVAKLIETARKEERQKIAAQIGTCKTPDATYYCISDELVEALLKEGEGK